MISNFYSINDLDRVLCPNARLFGDGDLTAHCRGEACAAWRWKPRLISDPEYMSAIKREEACLAQDEAKATGNPAKPSSNYHKKAVARVTRNPEGYGIVRDEGYCGLGGLPT